MKKIAAFALAVWMFAPSLCRAAVPEPVLDLLDAPVAYSANFQVSSPKGIYHGQVWHVPGRERREFQTRAGSQAVVLRRDTGRAYLLKPSGRWYVGLSLEAVAGLVGGLDGMVATRTRLGQEMVDGVSATRYRVDASAAKGGQFKGDAWFSRSGIMVKAVGMVTDRDGRAMEVQTSLSRITLGDVAESRFEMPSGWLGIDLSSVPAEGLEKAVESLRPMLER